MNRCGSCVRAALLFMKESQRVLFEVNLIHRRRACASSTTRQRRSTATRIKVGSPEQAWPLRNRVEFRKFITRTDERSRLFGYITRHENFTLKSQFVYLTQPLWMLRYSLSGASMKQPSPYRTLCAAEAADWFTRRRIRCAASKHLA